MKSTLSSMLRGAALLGLFAVLGGGLLSGAYLGTRDRIADNQRKALQEQLGELLTTVEYDNDPSLDPIAVPDLQPGKTTTAYRAFLGDEAAAVLIDTITPRGYGGDIRLLIGIRANGTITGVRVLTHRETPGLGDKIDLRRSDWISSFNGRALGHPPVADWAVRKDGGVFDQFTGATITPRAVVHQVRDSLDYFHNHQAKLFAKSPDNA
ncbi:MAG: electron transport complex subunit RsxG [Panacagrimonas sp.]